MLKVWIFRIYNSVEFVFDLNSISFQKRLITVLSELKWHEQFYILGIYDYRQSSNSTPVGNSMNLHKNEWLNAQQYCLFDTITSDQNITNLCLYICIKRRTKVYSLWTIYAVGINTS